MGDTQTIGNIQYRNISKKCKDRHISINAMCDTVGIRQSLLSDLHSGRSASLSVPTLMSIASFFEVTVDELITSNGNEMN